MSGTASGKAPRNTPQWIRDIQRRVKALENPRTLRFGSWVISTGDNGMPRFTKPGETIETGEADPVSVTLPRGTIITDEEITEAITGTPGPLEAIGLFLQGKWNPLAQMQGWWQQALDQFNVPDVAGWVLDLFGIKNQAQTAWSNASNALGQIGQFLSAAAADTMTTIGNMVKGTVNNFADILTGFGLGSIANWITDLLGTRGTASTGAANALNALGQVGQIISNAVAGTAATVGQWLATARTQAQNAVNNFADILTGLGLGGIANWITDLLGTRSNASTGAANALNALGQIGQFLTAAAQSTMTAVGNALKGTVNNFADILTGFGLGSVANWITDLLGTRGTAATAGTNAANALGQITQFLTAAAQSTMTAVGNAVKGTVNNFADILTGFGLGSVANWITDLLGTKSTASTAGTNASNALGQLTSFFTNAGNSLASTVGGWLATARTQAQNAATNFANILSGFGLGAVGDWITDLLGTKSTASTAGTNASNALGQITSFFTNAGNSVAATVGGWLATARTQAQNAATNFANILSGFGLGAVGDWITDLLGTKSTASTAGTNASNALGQLTSFFTNAGNSVAATVGGWLSTARSQAQAAATNFANILSGFGLGAVGDWISDLLGTKSTASTAGTNASNALGQLGQLITNAGQSLASGVGTMLANAANDTRLTLNNVWEGLTGLLTGGTNRTPAEVKTASAAVKSTADTANTNANTANAGLATANTKLAAKIRAADEMVLDPNIDNAAIWAGAMTGVTEVSTDVALVGTQALKLTAGGTTTVPVVYLNADGGTAVTNRGWAVRPGKRHYYAIWVWRPAGASSGTLRIQNRISVTGTTTDTYPAVLSVSAATLPVEQWTLVEGIYTMPETLTVESQARVPIDNSPRIIWDGNPTTGQVLYVGRVSVKDVTDAQNITDRMWEGLTGGTVTSYKSADEAKAAASGVKSVSDTAGANASNALGQLGQLITNAGQSLASGVGTMLANAANDTRLTLTNIWRGLTGSTSTANRTPDEVRTAAGAVKSTSDTALTNAATADAKAVAVAANLDTTWVKGANVLPNGNFDAPTPLITMTDFARVSITDPPVGGNYAMQVASAGAIRDCYVFPEHIIVAPGDKWYGECWVRKTTTGTVGTVHVASHAELDGGSASYPIFASIAMSSLVQNEWQKFGGIIEIPAGKNNLTARMSVRGNVPSGQIIQFKGFAMRPVTEAEAARILANAAQGTASTAGTNASNALGQLSQIISNAGQTLASGVGTMLSNAANDTRLTLTNIWRGLTGSTSTANRTPDEVRTAAAAVKSTADTADTNASTAGGNIETIRTNAGATSVAAIGTRINGAFTDIGALISAAPASTAATVGTALTNVVSRAQSTLNRLWEAFTGTSGSTSNKTEAEVKTVTAGTYAKANTASDNADTAIANAQTAQDTADRLRLDPENLAAGSDFEGDHPWSSSSWFVETSSASHSGEKRYRSTSSSGSGTLSASIPTRVAATLGDRFFVRFWARRDSAFNGTDSNSKFRAGGYGPGISNTLEGAIGFGVDAAFPAATWVEFTGIITITNPATNRVQFSLNNDGTAGYVAVDDIEIRRIRTADTIDDDANGKNLIKNMVNTWRGNSAASGTPSEVTPVFQEIKDVLNNGYIVQTITSTQTWTKPAGLKALVAIVMPSGQSGTTGQYHRGNSGGSANGGSGGLGGAFVAREFDPADIPSSLTVTIGAAGAGAPSAFGSLLVVSPGASGGIATQFGFSQTTSGAGNGGDGGRIISSQSNATAGQNGQASATAGGGVGGNANRGGSTGTLTGGAGGNGSAASVVQKTKSGGGGGAGGGAADNNNAFGGNARGGAGGDGGFPAGGGGGTGAAATPSTGGSNSGAGSSVGFGAAGIVWIYYRV